MEIEEYEARPHTVTAMQWDGTAAGADALIAWAGDTPDGLGARVEVADGPELVSLVVHEALEQHSYMTAGDHLVCREDDSYEVWSPDLFDQFYVGRLS